MREEQFIQQNHKKWNTFEEILDDPYHDPDQLSDLFVQITDDLSYSRTFYPNRSVRVYLNQLAQKVFLRIYKHRRSPFNRLWLFWTDELPQLVHEARFEFRLSLVIFITAMVIGALSTAMDPEFPRIILGDEYVNMTVKNMESGDPMAVYKESGAFGMALGITSNNLLVAFLTFIMGIFFSIGTAGILLQNGIMLGAFQYFFFAKGFFLQSFLTVWLHGTLEISSIIIAGAAGLTLGKGLLFPGTYSRMQAFQVSARRGMKIMLGITPLIIIAGIIESFLTRYTNTPDFIRGSFILLCLSFVLGYFVWYPRYKAKIGFSKKTAVFQLPPDLHLQVDFHVIKSSGEIFGDCFALFKKHLNWFAVTAAGTSLFYCIMVFVFTQKKPVDLFYYPQNFWGTLTVVQRFFSNSAIPHLLWINTIVFSIVSLAAFRVLLQYQGNSEKQSVTQTAAIFLKTIAINGIGLWLMVLSGYFTTLYLIMVFPLLALYNFVIIFEKSTAMAAIGRTFYLVGAQWGNAFVLYLLLLLIGLLFFTFIDSTIVWMILDFAGWNIAVKQDQLNQMLVVVLTFISVGFLALLTPLFYLGAGIFYFSLREMREAKYLQERIDQIGAGKHIRGLDWE